MRWFRRKPEPALPPVCWACVLGTPVGPMCEPCTAWMVALVAYQNQPYDPTAKPPLRNDFGPVHVPATCAEKVAEQDLQ